MTKELFRSEVIDHARSKLDGEVLLGTATSWQVMSYLAAIAVASGFTLAALSSFQQRERVAGWLVPQGGMIRVLARETGTIQELKVREGDAVSANQVLAIERLSSSTTQGDASVALHSLSVRERDAGALAARAALQKLEADRTSLNGKLELLKIQIATSESTFAVLTRKAALARDNFGRAETLNKRGFLSQHDLDQAETSALSAQQELFAAQGSSVSLRREKEDLNAQLRQLPALVAEASATAASAEAAIEEKQTQIAASSEYAFRAPFDGTITAAPLPVGQPVAPGATVVVLERKNSVLEAEVLIPSRSSGFVKVGQEVRLKYEAFPYQSYGTADRKIASISKTTLGPTEIGIPGLVVSEPAFKARVKLANEYISAYGEKVRLRPGMLLSADVVTGKKTLLELLFDPILAFARRR
jgi:membrane fusion protein